MAEVLPALLKQWIGGIVEASPVVDDWAAYPRNDLPTLNVSPASPGMVQGGAWGGLSKRIPGVQ